MIIKLTADKNDTAVVNNTDTPTNVTFNSHLSHGGNCPIAQPQNAVKMVSVDQESGLFTPKIQQSNAHINTAAGQLFAPADNNQVNCPEINKCQPPEPVIDKGRGWKSWLTLHNVNVTVRTLALGIAVATLFSSVAVLAGAAMGPLLIVVAAGFIIGALVGLFANRLSDLCAEVMMFAAKGRSVKTQANLAGLQGGIAARLHNANTGGIIFAATFSRVAGWLSIKLGYEDKAIVCGNASGSAVGTVDNLSFGGANAAVRTGASLGGFLGALVLPSIKHSAEVGESAGKGAYQGALWGATLDSYMTSLFRLVWWKCFRPKAAGFGVSPADLALGWWNAGDTEAGQFQWAGSVTVGTAAGVAKGLDIRTGGMVTQSMESVKTGLRDVYNDPKKAIPLGACLAVKGAGLAWQATDISKMIGGVYNHDNLSPQERIIYDNKMLTEPDLGLID